MRRRRYAQVGLGARHQLYRDAVAGKYSDRSELVALCDSNEGRLRLSVNDVRNNAGMNVPGYDADDFDRMIAETKPDSVIVTTKDCHHDTYVCRALELGCDVIVEKPMTTDAAKCRRIMEMQRETGKRVTVILNYRFSPPRTQLKELLMSGIIGEVLSVDFHWLLDIGHGADYFRRWHRNKINSGGLLVHKASHHFDVMNWWLSSVPERVSASGHRRFFVPKTAERYGLTNRGERCLDCAESNRCPFRVGLGENMSLKKLYLDCEQYDGYYRDRCVFSEKIDIEDSMSLVVDYRNGVKISYSLNTFMPWEGHLVSFNGSRGRIEHKCEETVCINANGSVPGAIKKEGSWTRVYPHRLPAYEEPLWTGSGGHGGADPVMLDYLFAPENQPPDKYLRTSDQRAGAWSILTGVAANHSMAENRPVRIDELVPDIELPDYPPMPGGEEALPLEQLQG